MTKFLPVLFATALSLLLAAPAHAGESDARALLDKGIESLKTQSSELTVRLERHKKEVITTFRFKTRTSNRDPALTKSWMLRLEPEALAGMQILALTPLDGKPTVKQYVSVSNTIVSVPNPTGGTNLFGTDFQVRDLRVLEHASGVHTVRGKDSLTIGAKAYPVTVIETVPDKGAYGKVVRFLDDERSLPLRVDYFDKAGTPIKRLTVMAIAPDAPLATHTRMEVLTGRGGQFTDMFVEEYAFDLTEEALPERTFTDEYLKEVGLTYQ